MVTGTYTMRTTSMIAEWPLKMSIRVMCKNQVSPGASNYPLASHSQPLSILGSRNEGGEIYVAKHFLSAASRSMAHTKPHTQEGKG